MHHHRHHQCVLPTRFLGRGRPLPWVRSIVQPTSPGSQVPLRPSAMRGMQRVRIWRQQGNSTNGGVFEERGEYKKSALRRKEKSLIENLPNRPNTHTIRHIRNKKNKNKKQEREQGNTQCGLLILLLVFFKGPRLNALFICYIFFELTAAWCSSCDGGGFRFLLSGGLRLIDIRHSGWELRASGGGSVSRENQTDRANGENKKKIRRWSNKEKERQRENKKHK